jgi:cytoskeletal protein CcmA (bactofilin family)
MPGRRSDEDETESRKGLFSRFNRRVSEAIETGRGEAAGEESVGLSLAPSEALATRRGRPSVGGRMVIPEGATVHGAITSHSETEIAGRVEGDVTVEGRLLLLPTALIAGNVKASSVRNEGLIEGNTDCPQELELAESGRCNGDIHAGTRVSVSGQVFGNIATEGAAVLADTAKVNGNIQTRQLVITEGAAFNGTCKMTTTNNQS